MREDDLTIRAAVLELVSASPPPHPYSRIGDVAVAGRVRPALRSGLAMMAASAAVVLAIGLVGLWISPSSPPASPPVASPTVDGLVPIPPGHLAETLLTAGVDYDDLNARLLEVGASFMCGRGGAVDGIREVCLIRDEGVVAVIPLRVPPGTGGRIDSARLDAPIVVGDLAEPFAVPHELGFFSITFTEMGEDVGNLEGALGPPGESE